MGPRFDDLLWAPIRAPERTLAGLLAGAGATVLTLLPRHAPIGLLLVLSAGAALVLLRPRWPSSRVPYGRTSASSAPPPLTPAQGGVRVSGPRFVDEHGRTLLLRGINLSGGSKLPATPAGAAATHVPCGAEFFDHRAVSFVGRPFPLSEADEHLSRLRLWGLTFVRLLVT